MKNALANASRIFLAFALLFAAAMPAAAQGQPSTDLLLPFFEVDVERPGLTTVFAVGNDAEVPVDVEVTVYSNWGIEILRVPLTLDAKAVKTVNLYDWLVLGKLPSNTLGIETLTHVQQALCGQRSERDQLFYSTEIAFNHAVGFITVSAQGDPRPAMLWGDFFLVDPTQDFAQGEALVDLRRGTDCSGLCQRHGLRFLSGGAFDGGTKIVIWAGSAGEPSLDGRYPENHETAARAIFRDEAGNVLEERELGFMSVEVIEVSSLGLSEPFGWIELITEADTFIAVDYSAENRYSAALRPFCLPTTVGLPPGGNPIAAIDIEKSTHGFDADQAPGPQIEVGDAVLWEYVVKNKGNVILTGIEVTDDQGVAVTCPETHLAPGASMVCTGEGVATLGQYANVGTVVGLPPEGGQVSDSDPSHYYGEEEPPPPPPLEACLDIEKATNGHDADVAPGPELMVGDAVTWTYKVKNCGEVKVKYVEVTDDQGVAVSCPKVTLYPGGSMTCTGEGTATEGQYANIGTVVGETPEGDPVSESDPSHYYGKTPPPPPPPEACLDIEKKTNGHDADAAPGPEIEVGDAVTWTYKVKNCGEVKVKYVEVTDDQGVAVSCPKVTLYPGGSMTCTGEGTATAGQYVNIGTVTGKTPEGDPVSESDPSHYYGTTPPPPPSSGDEGCTPGYWKNHADSWPATGYSTGQAVTSVFAQAAAYPAEGSATLIQALNFGGGPGVEGGVRNLLRAAVAGLLDAAHPGVDYPNTPSEVISAVDAALASGDRDTMLALASAIDANNNLGCPLN